MAPQLSPWSKLIVDILVEVEGGALERVRDTLLGNCYLCMSQSTRRVSLNKGYTQKVKLR